jgi:hypothetical protein
MKPMSTDDWIAIATMLLFGATLFGAFLVLAEVKSGHEENQAAGKSATTQLL